MIDECDLETHGFFLARAGAATRATTRAGRTPASTACAGWSSATRTTRAIVMWSLGNESGSGANLSAMAAWARERDPSRPLHYERDWSCRDVDVYSRMYAAARRGRGDRPRRGTRADAALDARRRDAVHPLRVRARDGQRPGRAVGVPGAVRAPTRAARAASSGSGSTTGIRRRRRATSSPTAATSASRCTTATSSPTGCSSPTARRRPACSSSRR